MTMHAVRQSAAAPPPSSESVSVRSPISEALSSASTSSGLSKGCKRSGCSAAGLISPSTKSRTVSRNSSCSAVRFRSYMAVSVRKLGSAILLDHWREWPFQDAERGTTGDGDERQARTERFSTEYFTTLSIDGDAKTAIACAAPVHALAHERHRDAAQAIHGDPPAVAA